MLKISRKICSLVIILTIMLLYTNTTNIFAAQNNIPNNLVGMDNFITKHKDGLLYLDIEQALKNDFSMEDINFVNKNLEQMNSLVQDGIATVDNNFNVTVYTNKQAIRAAARGESKYVAYWWGLHQYFMNSIEAQELVDTFSLVGDVATMSAVLGFAKGNVGKYVGMAATIVGVSSLMFRTQVANAAAPGNGIIMNCVVDKVGNSIYYTSQ